jgi:hypothetical protein
VTAPHESPEGGARGRRFRLAKRAGFAALRIALVGTVPTALSFLACYPSRRVLALSQASADAVAWQYFTGGILGDVAAYALPILLLISAGALVVGRPSAACSASSTREIPASRLAKIEGLRQRWFPNVAAAVIGLEILFAYVFALGVTEFRLQRGAYPVLSEMRAAMTSSDGVVGALPVLTSPRYLVPSLIAAAIALAGIVMLPRLLRFLAARRLHLAGATAVTLALVASAWTASARAEKWLPALNHSREIASPLPDVLHDLVARGSTVTPDKIRPLIGSYRGTPDEVHAGAHAYGFSDAAADGLLADTSTCSLHPLAEPLDGPTEDPLLLAAARLSRALFDGRAVDPIFWQVGVESFRAEDVHALNPAAPAIITPHTNRWYGDTPRKKDPKKEAEETKDRAATVAFRHVHQTGVRTAQAHSALMCGFGYLPFNMALVRDLGNVPLRCLPDVLVDAGFAPTAYYGHDFAFDNEGTFFRFHGVALVEKNHLPQDLPHGAWGAITDAPLYGHAFDDAAKRGGPQYNFVATLASHMPFDLPQDMPPALDKKVDAACHAPKELGIDDCHRIKTLAYADETLAAFVTRIEASPTADRTLLLLSADHSTNDNFVWDTKDRAGSLSRIPMILRVPEATLAAAPHPEEATAALTELQSLALSRGLSNADIPTIVLALVAGTRPMVTLEVPWRWHTLGAQTTRRAFRAPTGLRHESLDAGGAIAFFGVNAPAHMFWGEEGGAVHDTEVRNTALATTSDLEQPPTHAKAPLAFLGAFLDGWGNKCAQARWLRRDVRERRDGLDRRQ